MSATGTVLVTGAGGHLGPRIARLLAARSFTLAINDIDEQSAGLLAESIVGAVPFPADVSDDEAASRLVVDVTDRLGPIDIVINAAGVEGPIGAIVMSQRPVDLRSTPAGGTEPFQPVSPLVVKGVRVTAAPLAIHEVVPAS